jgi:hypothetical protein
MAGDPVGVATPVAVLAGVFAGDGVAALGVLPAVARTVPVTVPTVGTAEPLPAVAEPLPTVAEPETPVLTGLALVDLVGRAGVG